MSFQRQKRIVVIINLSFSLEEENFENLDISDVRELFADHKSI